MDMNDVSSGGMPNNFEYFTGRTQSPHEQLSGGMGNYIENPHLMRALTTFRTVLSPI
jgi:hypothetical protein